MRLRKTLIIAALPLALAVGCETSNEGKAGMNDKAAMQAQSDAKRAAAAANDAASIGFYQSSFTISSSTEWDLIYGAENADFVGVDDGTTPNTLALDNVGLQIVANGAHTLATGEIISAPTTLGTVVADLDLYPQEFLGWDNTGASNAGDEADNDFTIQWRCGTAEGDMNAVSLIEQTGVDPDRYVVNVLFELQISL